MPRLDRMAVGAALFLTVFLPARAQVCPPDIYEPDGFCVSSPTIPPGAVQARNFCDDSGDWARFNACRGRSYTIETSALGPNLDTFLRLYRNDCISLVTSDDNGNGGLASRIDWVADESGPVHALVHPTDFSGGVGRNYTLTFTGDTSPCSGWQASYGGAGADTLAGMEPTPDGGVAVLGTAGDDVVLLKLDVFGAIEWQRRYGGSGVETAAGLLVLSGGGYAFAATTSSFGAGGKDVWVVRLDASGNVLSQRAYGSSGDETAMGIVQAPSNDVFVSAARSFPSFNDRTWLLRLQPAGTIDWEGG